MKNKWTVLLVFLMMLLMTGCFYQGSELKNEVPADFNFRLTYGTYGKQKIDTFNHVVVKDLVVDGTVEASITLSDAEMREIYDQMLAVNIMGELDLEKDKQCAVEPEIFTFWEVQMNNKVKSHHYTSYCKDYPKDALQLLKLEDFIHNIVIEKEEYKALPEVNGSYE
jgi:hypothetical protein